MSTRDILESIDWPEDTLLLDFETYFTDDYTLSKSSIIEYITDPQFEFTGLGIQINDSKPVFINGPDVPWAVKRLKKKFGKGLHNVTVVAKNNKFDVGILAVKFGIFPPYTIDVEDLTRYYDSRMSQKLKDVASYFGLPSKGDTVQFKNLHWHELDQVAMKQYCLRDIEDEKSLLDMLLPNVDNPSTELALAQHTLNLYLKPSLDLDLKLAAEIRNSMDIALLEDIEKVEWVMDYATKDKKTIEKILRAKKLFPQILQDVLPEGEEVPMKKGKNEMIPATAKQDEEFQLLLAHSNEKVRNLCAAKAACTAWPLHRNKVERMINQAECSDGKIRIPLKYYGAHTGRWSGEEKINMLNMGGKGRGAPIHPLIAQVRSTVTAPEGYEFGIVDSAQIEARELAWISGQSDLLTGFANGEDVYSVFATKLFGEEVRKPTDGDTETKASILTVRRGFGKDAILGCVAVGTPVLTDNGLKNVEKIEPDDKLWDGHTWVNHKGVVNRGYKKCIRINDVWLTPEHEILTREGWTTAAELNTYNHKKEWFTENLQWLKSQKVPVGGSSPSNVGARVVEFLLRQEIIWSEESLHAVMSVLKRHPAKLRAMIHSYVSRIGPDCLTEFVLSLVDVRQNHMKDMVKEVSECGPSGSEIELRFLSIWQDLTDGTTHNLKSTESIMIGDTDRATFDSLPEQKILQTVDILYAGSRNRFQAGNMIVANCGYGMGADTFYTRCRQNATLRPMFDSGEYDFKFIKKLIDTYRKTYACVPKFWDTIESCFRFVTRYPHEVKTYFIDSDDVSLHGYDSDVKPIIKNALLTFWVEGSTTVIQLPSGRRLFYPHAKVSAKRGDISYQHGKLYGGKLTENVIQAMCRDLLCGWLLQCEEAGIEVKLHSYDELVTIVPVERKEEKLQEVIDIMTVGPDWAAGLPLAAEGQLSERYCK